MSSKIHPMLETFLKIGCSDMKAASAAFAVYMDLAEVKAVWDLQYALCQELDLIYLTAKDNATDTEPSIYLPLPASHSISAEWLLKVQNTLPIRNKRYTGRSSEKEGNRRFKEIYAN
ncbi:uncharacterized protein LOC117653363 isoform X2 [Thrips palmi]|uniref:Uncharacterized protein LOC117653363 isoform X2 n=1 Tax=Thrips palmi TaxID=161013 RepID=A0A6P9A9Z7_THRPL|nr:uncharacterized protein LOC117653363 isoform X2 [Thrips palmi]